MQDTDAARRITGKRSRELPPLMPSALRRTMEPAMRVALGA